MSQCRLEILAFHGKVRIGYEDSGTISICMMWLRFAGKGMKISKKDRGGGVRLEGEESKWRGEVRVVGGKTVKRKITKAKGREHVKNQIAGVKCSCKVDKMRNESREEKVEISGRRWETWYVLFLGT